LHAATTVRFSRGAVEDIRRYYALPPDMRFDVIPAGIVCEASDRKADPGRPEIRLLSVGRLVESKNLALLLDSLARLPEQPWRLEIVGEGPDRVRLEQHSAALGIAERVRFHGHRNDVDRFYAEADLFVFPSRLESYGLVILEAMAHGVPTLAIAADGVRYQNANTEIITHGVDGLVAADEAEFHSLLGDCIAQRVALNQLGQQARQTFEQRHQWSAVLDRWEDLLRDVTENSAMARQPLAV
jgi:glycosyltransferase involved in cell wall biosynthesis